MISTLKNTFGFNFVLWAMAFCFTSDISVITVDPPGPARPVFSYMTNDATDGEEIQLPVHRRFLIRGETGTEEKSTFDMHSHIESSVLFWTPVVYFIPEFTRPPGWVRVAVAGPPVGFTTPLRC